MRPDSRSSDQLREISIVPNYTGYAEGSILFKLGGTKVLCNASLIDEVTNWIRAQGRPHGWITAEYAILPRSITIEETVKY
jgi:ribonuclease PH